MLQFAQVAIRKETVVGLLLKLCPTTNTGFQFTEVWMAEGDIGTEKPNACTMRTVGMTG
ncbi:MAG: hypothetical protein Fur0022_13280 [Anaerolineales bacterium]